ncbi:MAG: sporulation protein YqfD [Erysipelotrichales bacterium]|nr:sporulation protein YqfD [Erysipelotrichales bacterium]
MIIIIVKNNVDRFIKKCIENNIDLYNIDYKDDILFVTINEKDYKNVKKLNYYSKIKIKEYLGKKKIRLLLKNNLYNFMLLFILILLIFIYSNIIVSIKINHENKEIINKVDELLKEKKIKVLSIKKDNDTLNRISDEILENNRDFLDFISIKSEGMKYIVNVEERILIEEAKEKERCHIIAKKSGVITSIIPKKGVPLIEKGNLVNAGDILISGEIILNEEIKDNVCSEGIVMANTWYKINIKYPLIETKKEYTKREKINIKIYNNYLKKRLYTFFDEETLLKLGNIKIVKQKETKEIDYNISAEVAKNKAIKEAEKKLLEKLSNDSAIIDKKVLKETTNNSTIELELFISVNESIGELVEYEGRDKIDTNEGV